MVEGEYPDLVDVFYRPFVRPLGNLVIVFAQAEADLLELVAQLMGTDEKTATKVLNSDKAMETVLDLVRTCPLTGYQLEELKVDGIARFWNLKEERNRLIHDEWFIGIGDEEIGVGTRGVPRKKGSPPVIWGDPDIERIWNLVREIRDCRSIFSHAVYDLRKLTRR